MKKPSWIETIDGHWLFLVNGDEVARFAPNYNTKYGKLNLDTGL